MGYQRRLSEASGRIVALLEKVPALEDESNSESNAESDRDEEATDHLPEKEDVR